jgi:hypothetical protein
MPMVAGVVDMGLFGEQNRNVGERVSAGWVCWCDIGVRRQIDSGLNCYHVLDEETA